jgi:integrase
MSYQKIAPRLYVKTSKNGAKLSEAAARKRAEVLSGVLATGQDPFGQRARKQMTFAEIVAEIIEIGTTGKKGWAVDAKGNCDTEQAYLRMINKDAPRLAKLQFNHPLIEDEVEAVLKPVWGSKKGEDMRSRIAKAFDRAVVRKLWTGENPANRDRIVVLLGEGRDSRSVEKGGDVENHDALPWQEVPENVAALAGLDGMGATATRFLILTTARASNVQYCSKSDIDRQARTWTVSGNGHTGKRMKAGVKHTYYLNDQAMEIINALWDRPGDLLFTNKEGNALGDTCFRDKLCHSKKRGGLGLAGRATVHGFRTSFGNWVRRHHATMEAIADAMLAHAEGKVKAAYFREDAVEVMQFLSTAWGDYCAPASNVRQLRAA